VSGFFILCPRITKADYQPTSRHKLRLAVGLSL
jgi:hypothetical protein